MSFPEISDRAPAWRFHDDVEQAGQVRLLVPGDVVGHEFGLFETRVDQGTGALAHYHQGFSESFYVVSGRVAVMAGREWRALGSGDVAHVPRDGVHAFRGLSDEPARMLILFVPAGVPRETYFRGMAAFGQRDTPPTPAEVDEFAASCDQVNLRDWTSGPIPE